MSAKHTPGPWFVGAQNDALYVIDRRPAHDNDYPNHDADTAPIARVYDDVRGHEDSGRCNAALIAAAPDLLAAAIKARSALSDLLMTRDPVVYSDALRALDEALAKTTRGAA